MRLLCWKSSLYKYLTSLQLWIWFVWFYVHLLHYHVIKLLQMNAHRKWLGNHCVIYCLWLYFSICACLVLNTVMSVNQDKCMISEDKEAQTLWFGGHFQENINETDQFYLLQNVHLQQTPRQEEPENQLNLWLTSFSLCIMKPLFLQFFYNSFLNFKVVFNIYQHKVHC